MLTRDRGNIEVKVLWVSIVMISTNSIVLKVGRVSRCDDSTKFLVLKVHGV